MKSGRALDSLVKACVDVVLQTRTNILLGKRIVDPHLTGGLLVEECTGESIEMTAARHTKRDTGLILDPKRFDF